MCFFCRVTEYIDKIDLETLSKWNVFWEQCIANNQVYHEYQWADICVKVLASQRLPNSNSKCITYYFKLFFTIDKTLYKPFSVPEIQKSLWSLKSVLHYTIVTRNNAVWKYVLQNFDFFGFTDMCCKALHNKVNSNTDCIDPELIEFFWN